MPSPKNVLPPPDGFASPVPAHSVPSEARASAPIAWVSSLCQAGVQVTPPSTLFMIPPLDTAAYTVLGVAVPAGARVPPDDARRRDGDRYARHHADDDQQEQQPPGRT